MKIKKHVCPHCGNDTFATTAHVMQDWKVDGKGNFISVINDCVDITARPDNDNIWTCTECGSEGIIVETEE